MQKKNSLEIIISSYTDSLIELTEELKILESERDFHLTKTESIAPTILSLCTDIGKQSLDISTLNSELLSLKAKKEAVVEFVLTLENSLLKFDAGSKNVITPENDKVDKDYLTKLCSSLEELNEELLRKEKQLSSISTGCSSKLSLSEIDRKIKGSLNTLLS